ncbi:hypothetical protein GCM10011316_37980 [Roseibium aquae]|uniref:Uncharacterized protein n=2 Tax=Roseibium aquae TaxID=1323746 RepID=A0A916TNI5_9HYPH|nr:hypothetical protein GCM10011316_37980 [Roseibium aquae]
MPGLPIRGRFRHSNVSIWLLAICIAVALILRTTTAAEAQERLQDWLPDVLELPGDVEVLADRQVGSTIRMLTLRTSANVDDLLIEWEVALRANGYAIGRGRDESLDGVIEFSGTGIVNAKIIVAQGGDDDGRVIEIDATLR